MLISICIPTYNSGEKLERLLNSIQIQTFKNYEIIISDDSRNDDVKNIINAKYAHLPIKYYWNEQPLGTPNNWNNAVEKSKGDWINLMHHDDWFNDAYSLKAFVDTAIKKPNVKLIFSAYQHYYLETNIVEPLGAKFYDLLLLHISPFSLFKLFMGNPSTTFINKSYKPYSYDTNFKWLIDYDFFTTLLRKEKSFAFVKKNTVSLGMHSEQVTATVLLNPNIEIPESIGLVKKHGQNIFKNIFAYDFFWRMYRNLNVRNMQEFNSFLGFKCDEKRVIKIIESQAKVSSSFLKNGFVSKALMIKNYILNYFTY